MQGTPLLVGDVELQALKELIEKAEANPVDMTGLTERLKEPAKRRRHLQQMTAQTVYLPMAYAVTYSIELGHPGGKARHMSMSVSRKDRVPNEHAVWMVAVELGFTGKLEDCVVWLEKLSDGGDAVNIVQLIPEH
jgi:hypothetical protein